MPTNNKSRTDQPTSTATFQEILHPGTLLMFSGESRWLWQHRIVPTELSEEDKGNVGDIYRMSLVLGCSVKK